MRFLMEDDQEDVLILNKSMIDSLWVSPVYYQVLQSLAEHTRVLSQQGLAVLLQGCPRGLRMQVD